MGLDKENKRVFDEWVTMIPRALLGFSAKGGVWGYLVSLVTGRRRRRSPLEEERERYVKEVREQLTELKRKGLSIPIFTL